jgi:hypothetical protein
MQRGGESAIEAAIRRQRNATDAAWSLPCPAESIQRRGGAVRARGPGRVRGLRRRRIRPGDTVAEATDVAYLGMRPSVVISRIYLLPRCYRYDEAIQESSRNTTPPARQDRPAVPAGPGHLRLFLWSSSRPGRQTGASVRRTGRLWRRRISQRSVRSENTSLRDRLVRQVGANRLEYDQASSSSGDGAECRRLPQAVQVYQMANTSTASRDLRATADDRYIFDARRTRSSISRALLRWIMPDHFDMLEEVASSP